MSKINNIIDIIEAGLKAEGLRHRAIANNMANLQTPGYRRVSVKFQELLARAMDSSDSVDVSEIKPELYQPKNTPVKSNGNDVGILYTQVLFFTFSILPSKNPKKTSNSP